MALSNVLDQGRQVLAGLPNTCFLHVNIVLHVAPGGKSYSDCYNHAVARAISGKVVIITGASSGIGRATALRLARERANLVLVARREKLLVSLAEDVQSAGG